jgi:hypothetical protein
VPDSSGDTPLNRTFNAVVAGSSPARLTIIFNKLEGKSTLDFDDFASFLSSHAIWVDVSLLIDLMDHWVCS